MPFGHPWEIRRWWSSYSSFPPKRTVRSKMPLAPYCRDIFISLAEFRPVVSLEYDQHSCGVSRSAPSQYFASWAWPFARRTWDEWPLIVTIDSSSSAINRIFVVSRTGSKDRPHSYPNFTAVNPYMLPSI
ncbi:hypothetical protein J1614_006274 [Plenodomus biglobosus]|nr:hypothetical protein J1614_006274 [Plenodomus biglobosus]